MKRSLILSGCLVLAACQKSAKVDDRSLPAAAAVRGEETTLAAPAAAPGVEGSASNLAIETAQNYQQSLNKAKSAAATANRLVGQGDQSNQRAGE
jgi:hypothetical protein